MRSSSCRLQALICLSLPAIYSFHALPLPESVQEIAVTRGGRSPATVLPSTAMCSSCATASLLGLLLVSSLAALVSAQRSTSPWKTLSGQAPIVVARGGFSGIFPDSSSNAYNLAIITSLPNVVSWCDVQLTKDAFGICAPFLNLDNCSDIGNVFPDRSSTYAVVDGDPGMKGWFSVDFNITELSEVILTQGIYSRTNKFDGGSSPILTVQDLQTQLMPPGLWLNIQHDQFFTQHGLSMRSFVLSTARSMVVDYISSPEANFLRSIPARLRGTKTKLIFRFVGQMDKDPSTNQTYKSLLGDLSSIKKFASGILVPKTYIWPVGADNYVQPHLSLVSDAHKAGLEVYASEFANDLVISYNFSYDPIQETLAYIDNGEFSVDGLLTDFPITQSEAIGCFAHIGKNDAGQDTPLVISYNGASGDYPSCTDVAYKAAIADGANIIDCPVQISKDGIPFCFGSINLMDGSNVAQSSFRNSTTTVPQLFSGTGIYAFSLTWADIQTLTPAISNPYAKFHIYRNPMHKNDGKFVSLSDFLGIAKNTSLTGVLIAIENAAYLAENQGLDVVGSVLEVLNKSGYGDPTLALKVMVQSTNSSTLLKVKQSRPAYELVYEVDENIRDADDETVQDIKSFAHSVVLKKTSMFPANQLFITGIVRTFEKLKSFNLTVYAKLFSNEFVSQAWDFFSDATVEINSFVMGGVSLDGVITDFPKTAAAYKKNRCIQKGYKTPVYMTPVEPGALYNLITAPYLPPATAPFPVLTEDDVSEPPLPPVAVIANALAPSPAATNGSTPPKNNAQLLLPQHFLLSGMSMLFATILML